MFFFFFVWANVERFLIQSFFWEVVYEINAWKIVSIDQKEMLAFLKLNYDQNFLCISLGWKINRCLILVSDTDLLYYMSEKKVCVISIFPADIQFRNTPYCNNFKLYAHLITVIKSDNGVWG